MRFFYRYRKATSLVSLVALVFGMAVAPAAAEYDPRTGRFLQRDQHGTGVVLQPSLPYHAANPTVTVSMAYELQFADGMNFYQFVRSNPITGRDPSGLFAYMDITTATGLQATLAGLYGDVSASLVDAMKGIALLQSERYAVLDSALDMSTESYDFHAIDALLKAQEIFQAGTLGLFVGVGAIKAGRAFFKMLAARAGGRSRLVQRLGAGTESVRRFFGFGKKFSPIPGSYMRMKYTVDMRKAPGSITNAAGFPRNRKWFWERMTDRHRKLLSEKNSVRIADGVSPIVDQQWVKYYPEHTSFMGDTLIHHHINGGPIATPLPESVHRSWMKVLHSGECP